MFAPCDAELVLVGDEAIAAAVDDTEADEEDETTVVLLLLVELEGVEFCEYEEGVVKTTRSKSVFQDPRDKNYR